jgi:5-(carboxyamino)imidazole ribonucleotide synthase
VTLTPPATIGIVGGGQLGMMAVREAQRMGYRTVVLDPDPNCSASRLADETIAARFDDLRAATELAERSDVVTYEFENVNVEAIRTIEQTRTVYPGSSILEICQHRRLEKQELQRRGLPVVDFRNATSAEEMRRAIDELGFPVVVKTATAGYDGKGQAVLRDENEAARFVAGLNGGEGEFVVERFIDLAAEVSVVVVRTMEGTIETFPVVENVHRNNILHTSTVPACVAQEVSTQAEQIGRTIVRSFGMVGVMCVEMFVTNDGTVLVNELAPRPHNSGHYTLDACTCSQFEALVRTVCGLPFARPRLMTPCAMVNILGKHVGRIDHRTLHGWSGVKYHWYGKHRVEPNRKMGHVTVLGDTPAEVEEMKKRVEAMIGEA